MDALSVPELSIVYLMIVFPDSVSGALEQPNSSILNRDTCVLDCEALSRMRPVRKFRLEGFFRFSLLFICDVFEGS